MHLVRIVTFFFNTEVVHVLVILKHPTSLVFFYHPIYCYDYYYFYSVQNSDYLV